MTDHHTITDRDTQPGTLTDARAGLPGRVDTGRVDTERSCPVCGTRFTPSPRKPAHTYCCQRCRATAWRHRRRDAARRVTELTELTELTAELTAERATSSSTTSTTTTDVNHVTNDVTNDLTNDVDENEDGNEVHAVRHCPHCRQPIALITLIVAPAAAHVTIPTLPPIPTRPGRSG